jgi:hypothetical protein
MVSWKLLNISLYVHCLTSYFIIIQGGAPSFCLTIQGGAPNFCFTIQGGAPNFCLTIQGGAPNFCLTIQGGAPNFCLTIQGGAKSLDSRCVTTERFRIVTTAPLCIVSCVTVSLSSEITGHKTSADRYWCVASYWADWHSGSTYRRYEPEGCGFDSRLGLWDFFIDLILPATLWTWVRFSV